MFNRNVEKVLEKDLVVRYFAVGLLFVQARQVAMSGSVALDGSQRMAGKRAKLFQR